MEEVEEAKQKSDYFVSILKVCDIKLYRYRGRMKTGLGDQAMDSHYVNVDSVTLPSSNSIVFLNCISQLYFSTVYINCIIRLINKQWSLIM